MAVSVSVLMYLAKYARNGSVVLLRSSSSSVPLAVAYQQTVNPRPETPVSGPALTGEGERKFFCGSFSFKKSAYCLEHVLVIQNVFNYIRTKRTEITRFTRLREAFSMRYSQQKCPVMTAFRADGKIVYIPCGKWSCAKCQKRLARSWSRRVYLQLEQQQDEILYNGKAGVAIFITFTLDGRVKSVIKGFEIIKRLWDVFRKRMQRASDNWKYVAFVEGQPERGGMPHFHIISNHVLPIEPNNKGYTSKHKVHNFAKEIGFGFEADQKVVSDKGAAYYVSKYASKQHPSTPKNFRRIRTARHWCAKEQKPKRLPYVVRGHDETLANYLIRANEIIDKSIDELYDLWAVAQDQLAREQAKTR